MRQIILVGFLQAQNCTNLPMSWRYPLSRTDSPKGAGWPQVDAAPGPYQITKRLPAAEDGEFQYEIRNILEEYNRIARESDLTRT